VDGHALSTAPIRALLDRKEGNTMLGYAIAFFIIALIAAVFGFGGIAAGAVGIGKILFFGFLILTAVTLVIGLVKGKPV
jgi:uncharacterized membrane protein YtjA (UPF0391 family)